MIQRTLNPKILDKDVEQVPIRKGYGEGLFAAGEADERVVALCADLTESTQTHLFAQKFPKDLLKLVWQNKIFGFVASGMAAMGKIPLLLHTQCFPRAKLGSRFAQRFVTTTVR